VKLRTKAGPEAGPASPYLPPVIVVNQVPGPAGSVRGDCAGGDTAMGSLAIRQPGVPRVPTA